MFSFYLHNLGELKGSGVRRRDIGWDIGNNIWYWRYPRLSCPLHSLKELKGSEVWRQDIGWDIGNEIWYLRYSRPPCPLHSRGELKGSEVRRQVIGWDINNNIWYRRYPLTPLPSVSALMNWKVQRFEGRTSSEKFRISAKMGSRNEHHIFE